MASSVFTDEMDAYIIEHYRPGKTREIARKYGISKKQLQSHANYLLKRQGLPSRYVHHEFTEAEDTYIIANSELMTDKEMGKALGMRERAVRARRTRIYGAKLNSRYFKREEDEYIINNNASMTAREIADALGRPFASVKGRLHKIRIEAKKKGDTETLDRLVTSQYTEMRPLKIGDGYDHVPWHMRQSTRSQWMPRLNYNETEA